MFMYFVTDTDVDGAVPHGDVCIASAKMIAKDSVNRTGAADVYVDILDVDVDVSGAIMASE